jgi:hypothetical protein
MRKVVLMLTGEVQDDTPLEPGNYIVAVKSREDGYFDVFGPEIQGMFYGENWHLEVSDDG